MEAARPALEHGSSRTGRRLRVRRLQLALWIAVAEVVLVVFGVVSAWAAVAVAALLVFLHLAVGRKLRWDIAREVSSIAATSQVFAALVPALLLAVGVLALVALVAVAALVAVVLLASRGR